MEIKYKIKQVKFYQAVELNKVQTTYVINPDYIKVRVDNKNNSQISVNEYGVLLENEDEIVQVSWNNVAYINYDKSQPTDKIAAKPGKKSVDFRDI